MTNGNKQWCPKLIDIHKTLDIELTDNEGLL